MGKHIGIVDNSVWNIHNFRLGLLRRLRAEGYRVTVLAPPDKYLDALPKDSFDAYIPLRRLAPRRKNPLGDLLLVVELYRAYRRAGFDLAIHYTIKPNIFGSIAARLAGTPSMAVITGLGYTFLHGGWLNRLAFLLYRLAFREARRVIFYNADDLALFRGRGLIGSGQGAVVVGSGVDTGHFQPWPPPLGDRFVFLYVGRLLYDKGLREYVEAARRARAAAPGVECWVLGDYFPGNPAAVPESQMREWAASGAIRYLGAAADVRPFIAQARAVVLPSYREGMPRALLEGMSMAKPAIATRVAGCRHAVFDGYNGLLVPPRDPGALAEAMLQLYRLPPGALAEMGRRGRARVLEAFDERITSSVFVGLIGEELGKI
jgi:glycosyltransferase involved in cell wall biosynthesis